MILCGYRCCFYVMIGVLLCYYYVTIILLYRLFQRLIEKHPQKNDTI